MKNTEAETNINDLPDEVLHIIFQKLQDAKCLCRCYLISKRFASLVLQINSVFLRIPPCLIYHDHQNGNTDDNFPRKFFSFLLRNIFTNPFQYILQISNSKPPCEQFDPVSFRAAIEFLKQFQGIQNIRIEVPWFGRKNEGILKWHAEFGTDLNFCAMVFVTSFLDMDPAVEDLPDVQSLSTDNELFRTRMDSATQCMIDAYWRRHVLLHIIGSHGGLKEATMVDSKEEGTVRLGAKGLANLRCTEATDSTAMCIKMWHVPVLGLPKALSKNGVMKEVTLIIIGPRDWQDSDDDCFSINGAFEEHELYREVVKWFFVNCRNDATTFSLNLEFPQV